MVMHLRKIHQKNPQRSSIKDKLKDENINFDHDVLQVQIWLIHSSVSRYTKEIKKKLVLVTTTVTHTTKFAWMKSSNAGDEFKILILRMA